MPQRAVLLIPDPSRPGRVVAALSPRLRERGYRVASPAFANGLCLQRTEESFLRLAQEDRSVFLAGFGGGCAYAARVAQRHDAEKLALVFPPFTPRALGQLPGDPIGGETCATARRAMSDAYLILCATLLLWPGAEETLPCRAGRRFASRLPECEAMLIPDAAGGDLADRLLTQVGSALFSFFERDSL